MAKVNYNQLRENLHRQSLKQVKALALRSAENKYAAARKGYIKEFENHPVTQEINNGKNAGMDAANITGTLNGKGNLWGFIGFELGSDPIQAVRNQIEDSFDFNSNPRVQKVGDGYNLIYRVTYPGLKELEAVSPMPWEGGRSWLSAVETFITGLSHFIYFRARGRSGAGVQSKKPLRELAFTPIRYMSDIIKGFEEKFK